MQKPTDFYIRTHSGAEWIGSTPFNGHLFETLYPSLVTARTAKEFRNSVKQIASECDDFVQPTVGWPWKWSNSASTDYSYVFFDGEVEVYRFGKKKTLTDEGKTAYSDQKATWFPDMLNVPPEQGNPYTKPTPEFLEISVEVRYWEDATVNDVVDKDGTLVPLRNGDRWAPTIRLKDGQILDWPEGTTAEIYYKVCDQGEYWLRNSERRVYKNVGHYVPDEYLCKGAEGYGDYIILSIDGTGKIKNWWRPKFKAEEWEAV